MHASGQLILLTRNGWTGAALRANESGLFAKVSAHVVKTRASDSKFCVRASKVKFRLSACPIIGVGFRPPVPADNRKSTVLALLYYIITSNA